MTWGFKANFSNARPAGSSARRIKEEGYYKVNIRDTEETTTKAGNPRALFRLSVAEGEHSGATETFGINLYTGNDDDYLLDYWMVILLSIGVKETKLSQDKDINLTCDLFKGKKGFIHYTPAASETSYPSFKWLTEEDYNFFTKKSAPVQAAIETAPAVAPAPTPTAKPAPPKTQADSGDPLSFLEI